MFYLKSLYQELVIATIEFLPNFISGIFIFLLFYAGYVIAGKLFDKILSPKDSSHLHVIHLLKKTTRVFLITFGLITMLGTWGIDVRAVIAGLGLTGVALGIALKDIIASLLAGVIIMIYKPFTIGDDIEALGVEGRVSLIDLRYTTIESNNRKHLIPNSKILSEKVTIL